MEKSTTVEGLMEENCASSDENGLNIGGNDGGDNTSAAEDATAAETVVGAVEDGTQISNAISADSIPHPVKQKKDGVPPSDNASSSSSSSRKKFRVVSLHFPLDYSETVLMELMKESQSFHLWFEREMCRPDQVKRGGLSVSFDTEQAAKDAYLKIKDKTINGVRLKVQAPSWMDEFVTSARTEEEPKANPPAAAANTTTDNAQNFESLDTKRKLFVSQLLPTTDDDLIFAVFGRENLQNVDIMLDEKRKDGTRTAVLTFHTPELAEQSKHDYDGFVVDDGELSKPMKILLYSDYLNKKQSEKNRKEAKKVENVPKTANPTPQHQQISAAEKSHAEEIIPAPSLQNEKRGKAGNLWSAQIVENRCVDVYVEKPVIIATSIQSKAPTLKDEPNVVCSVVREQHIEEKISTKQRKASPSPTRSDPSRVEVCEDSRHAKSCEPFIDSHVGPETEIGYSEEHARFSGELSDAEISRAIDSHIEQHRLNWAEVHSLEELWKIVDEVVKAIGWQPESALKQGMQLSLEKAETASETEWWQRHIQFLIRMWKREVETETRSKVRKQLHLASDSAPPSKSTTSHETTTIVVSPAAPHYVPLPPSPKMKRKSGKRALMELMGVGSFLTNVHNEGGFSEPEATKNERGSRRKRANSRNVSKRSKRASSCESGEASSTTTPSSDSDTDSERGKIANSAGGSRKKPADRRLDPTINRSRQRRQRPPSLPRSIERVDGPPPLPQPHVMDSHTTFPQHHQQMMTSSSGPQVTQPWTGANQVTPSSLVQMMPMMMQMFQMRMTMSSASAQQQFQQQFQQIYQQIRAHMGSAGAQPTVDPITGFPPNLPNMQQQSSQAYGNASASSSSDPNRSNQFYGGGGGTGYSNF